MDQIYDRLPSGTLDAFHKFRLQNYNYTYLCRNCKRSFDTKEPVQVCKFCNQGPIVELSRVERVKKSFGRTKPKYYYVCSTCDAEFETNEPVNNCHFCRTKWLHVHKWEDLGKADKFSIKFRAAIKNMASKKEKHRTSIHKAFSNNKSKEGSVRARKITTVRKRQPFAINFRRRPKEEMPTY